MNQDRLLSDLEVAERYGIDVQTLRNNRYLGRGFPYLKLGRTVRYRIHDIENYLAAHRVVPGEKVAR